MAIWKEQSVPKREVPPMSPDPLARRDVAPLADLPPTGLDTGRRAAERDLKESIIASDITIEGKIEGSGHIRIAGRFKGDVHVQGNLTIESGAKLTGGVRATAVIVGGELDGNIDAAARVELLATGVLNGDLKAGSLTVAAGSRMRGHAEFGWDEAGAKPRHQAEGGPAL
jgi:cytoskeletal protein CcmA (bactofilin family)